MLNYLGPNVGPQGPVTNVLPPAQPGTMPSGIPGARPAVPPAMPQMPHGSPRPMLGGGAPSPIMQRNVAPPANVLSAILHHAANASGPPPPEPHPEYMTTTQEDGSILLHIKGPHGQAGPVVKVIPPIKRGGPPDNSK